MESSLQALGFVWELPLPCNICSSQRKRNVAAGPEAAPVQPWREVGLEKALSSCTVWWHLSSDF